MTLYVRLFPKLSVLCTGEQVWVKRNTIVSTLSKKYDDFLLVDIRRRTDTPTLDMASRAVLIFLFMEPHLTYFKDLNILLDL